MKIQLIFPDGGSRLSSTGILPPVGIISLATYLKKQFDYEVELYDEAIDLPKPELTKDILTLSVTGANYLRAIEEYAKPAKRNGAIVVLGGPHATIKHKQILENQTSIDAVIRGDGEIAFSDYIQDISKQDYKKLKVIKNLTYRDERGDIAINPSLARCEQVDLNLLPTPDYRLLGRMLKKYEENFQKHEYRKEGYTRFVSFESQKGCAKADKKGRCRFCARIDKGLRRLNPNEFWKRIKELYDPNGKTMIWDVSDSFPGKISEDDNWLKEIAKNKPSDLENKINFKIFARADELDEENVRYLKNIGVYEVFIGIESGDQEKLDIINKGSTLEDNLMAVRNLKKYGIQTYVSLIYGFQNENLQSLKKSYFHTKDILENGNIAAIGARCMFPLAGMAIHNELLNKMIKNGEAKIAEQIKNSDCYDDVELQKLWIKHMTNTNYEEIVEHHKKMMELAKEYNVRINDENRLLLS